MGLAMLRMPKTQTVDELISLLRLTIQGREEYSANIVGGPIHVVASVHLFLPSARRNVTVEIHSDTKCSAAQALIDAHEAGEKMTLTPTRTGRRLKLGVNNETIPGLFIYE